MACTCSSQELQCLLHISAGCCHVSGASKSITFYGFHNVILFFPMFKVTLWSGLPALSTPLKKPNKQTFHLPKKHPQTALHLHLSIHIRFVGTFLTAITETLESTPEQQKLLSLAPRSNQMGVYFIAPINFLLTVLEVCKEGRREEKKKAVQECRLGKVPTINGVAATSGYLKIRRCQVPGGFCCLWQLVIIIGRLLLCIS